MLVKFLLTKLFRMLKKISNLAKKNRRRVITVLGSSSSFAAVSLKFLRVLLISTAMPNICPSNF